MCVFSNCAFFSEYYMGDNYAEALGSGMKTAKYKTKRLNIERNRLSCKGAKAIIQGLNEEIQEVNLGNNPQVGLDAYRLLADKMRSTFTRLSILNIDGNNAGDAAVEMLCLAASRCNNLHTLNLSRNCITDVGAEGVSYLVKTTPSIRAFYMAWNRVRETGGAEIAYALEYNMSIVVFDASFNSFGARAINSANNSFRMAYSEAAEALRLTFKENNKLIHVDLSHNQFSELDCQVMAGGLVTNHTLMGLHMLGNECDTDALGFLRASKSPPSSLHIMSRISRNLASSLPCSKLRKWRGSAGSHRPSCHL